MNNVNLNQLIETLKVSGQTLSLAESCTGGLVAATLTQVSGVSQVFRGGVVSYHADVKTGVLGVDAEVINQYGEVSTEVAEAMAKGAHNCMTSDWALSITGIAGPNGGTPEKPVGTVCFAVVGPDVAKSIRQNFNSDWSRLQIQQASMQFAFNLLDEHLNNN